MIKLLLSSLILAISFQAVADDQKKVKFFGVSDERAQPNSGSQDINFYEGKERGWFWYESEPEPLNEEPPEELATLPVTTPQQQEAKPISKVESVKPLSSQWFRKNMDAFRDKAVDYPTKENVETYLFLQRVMLDKASTFSQVSQQVVMNDPLLDENSRRPISTFGGLLMDDMATEGVETASKKLAEMAGLWFFYDSTCQFCIKQAVVLNGLMNAYNFKVIPISLDGQPLPGGEFPKFMLDHGQAKKLGVETTPALFIVKPGDGGGAIQLGQGLLSGEDIIRRAITMAHQNNWLDKKEYNKTLKINPIQVDSHMVNNIGKDVLDNPTNLVNIIRENLRKQIVK